MNTLHPQVAAALAPVFRERRRLVLWRGLAWGWLSAGLLAAALVWAARSQGWQAPYARNLFIGLMVVGSLGWVAWSRRRGESALELARSIEERDPKLRAMLLTAVEQTPSDPEGGWGYLQERLIQNTLEARRARPWDQPFVERSFLAKLFAGVALAVWLVLIGFVPNPDLAKIRQSASLSNKVEVTPGDAEVEKDHAVAVMARFPGQLPAQADLVWRGQDGVERRMALARNLSDPVFGGTLPSLQRDTTYRIEHGKKRTQDYKLTVFEKPTMTRADALLSHPAYTALGERTVRDTRRVTAVEGTKMALELQLNKAVGQARLVASNRPPIMLQTSSSNAVASLPQYLFLTNAVYGLELVDLQNRTNVLERLFHFEAVSNRPPEIKILAPRGDTRVTPLEEVDFQAEVRDDFGVLSAGLSYTIPGQATNTITLASRDADGKIASVDKSGKVALKHALALEAEKVAPGALVAWHFWAEDHGPDGLPRRVTSDLFFSEVRPFLEIYRQGDLSQQQQSEGGGGQANQTMQLAELQKQILNATWKLQSQAQSKKTSKTFAKDVSVVKESQEQALKQLASLAERGAGGGRAEAAMKTAQSSMEQAVEALDQAAKSPEQLSKALQAEQSAYQALLRMAPREHEVTQSRERGGGGGGENRNQSDLDQLELKPSDQRYETQRQASARPEAGKNEEQQILNRLKELAQRQQDLNDRLNELAAERNRARTEEEKEEIDRRLKRLREEERQMLEDVDDLAQRLERRQEGGDEKNLRERTREARDQVRQAADALDSKDVNDALAAGNRAQRQFQQMREDARREASGQLEEQLRQLRQDARELAQKQTEIHQRMEALGENKPRALSAPSDREALSEAMAEQIQRMTNVWNEATKISEASEASEPILSRQLYDTLRQTAQQEAKSLPETRDQLMREGVLTRGGYEALEEGRQKNRKPMEVASNLLKNGSVRESAALESKVLEQLQSLQKGVDSASSRVLGDDSEALRRARRELDALAEALSREAGMQGTNGTDQASSMSAGEAGASGARTNLQAGASSAGGARGTNQLASNERSPSGQGQRGQDAGREPGNSGRGEQAGRGEGGGQQGESSQAEAGSGQRGGPGENSPAQAQAGGGRGGSRRSLADRGQGQRGGNGAVRGGGRNGGGGGGGGDWNLGPLDAGAEGPLTGNGFGEWTDRLRDVEDMLDLPELRNRIAGVRERSRELRMESRRTSQPLKPEILRKDVLTPLTEVRTRIMEELARRESKDALVPLDRDPVPARYSELVRRYYERLGQGN